MPRRRVAVVLLPPEALTARIDGLRAATGEPRPERLPPHITLVPPVNVAADDGPALTGVLRSAASAARPFGLRLGPAESFLPATPTLHLAVTGRPADLDALHRLRTSLFRAPLDRPDTRPFVPHVTLRTGLDPSCVEGGLVALTGVVGGWLVDRLHLLEHHPDPGAAWWEPVAEEPFGDPAVVGRGGLEVVLRTTHLVEPAVRGLIGALDVVPGAVRDASLVVTAERPDAPGVPVGAALADVAGAVADLAALVVAPPERGTGVGAHLLAALRSAAAGRGVQVLVCRDARDGSGFLARHGFVDAGAAWVRAG